MLAFLARLFETARPARLLLLALAVGLLPGFSVAQDNSAPSSAALIELLKDDAARNALIADLERASTVAEPVASAPEQEVSFGRRIAETTQGIAEDTADRIVVVWKQLMTSGSVFSGLTGDELQVLTEALTELALVLVLTVTVLFVLRRIAMPFYARMGDRAGQSGIVQTGFLFAGSIVIDIAVVLIAWAIGYAVMLAAMGDFGQIGLRQTLYLNAFLAVELGKVGLRAILSPTSSGLRTLPLKDAAARSLSRHANVVVSVIGYGQLLVVPIINERASFLAGRGVSVLLSVLVLLYLVTLVLSKRRRVAAWLLDRLATTAPRVSDFADDHEGQLPAGMTVAPASQPIAPKGVLASLARNWHWGALFYLAMMFAFVMTRPTFFVIDALQVSGKVALAVIAASLVSGVLARAVARGIHLPPDVNARMPFLERRLNGFVPAILKTLRSVVIVAVTLFALDSSGVIPVRSWLESQIGLHLAGTTLSLMTIGLVAGTLWLVMNSWVDYRLNAAHGKIPTARETTLLTLLRNAATIALLILTTMFCLSEIGLDIGPLLASAGVLGLAIGFGAQKMVQDIITGVFIQFENAINVGDVVTVGGITGGVEKLTVRSVSLRDLHGVFHIIPFSSVDSVSNFTREFSYFVADMGVAYRENVDEVKQAMFDAFAELRADPEQGAEMLGDLEWMGLNSFGDSAVMLRARIKTRPGKQWGMGRAYNAILKRVFDERGIEIPFPHQTIFFGEAKDGTTQALTISDQKAA